jgi:3,4-dihydroxy-2-butanone 4-phosphate synthase
MRVELTVDRASVRSYDAAGTVIDLPADEARRLIKAGHAIPVRAKPVETTSRRGRKETAA